MKLITEEINPDNVKVICEEKDGEAKKYFIEGVFMQADIKNRNGRMYPSSILEAEVNRYNKEYIEKNRGYGELGHPQGPTINLERVSHIITSLKKEGSDFIGRAQIVTENGPGKIVKGLLNAGGQLGVSSRGMGSLKLVNGINEVQNDFMLATPADIVADPSAPAAFVNGIMEGVEWIYENERWIRMAESAKNHIQKTKSKDLDAEQIKVFERFIQNL